MSRALYTRYLFPLVTISVLILSWLAYALAQATPTYPFPYAEYLTYSDAAIADSAPCFSEHYFNDNVYCYLRVETHASVIFTFTEGAHTATSFAGLGSVRIGDLYGEYGQADKITCGAYWASFEWETDSGRILVYARTADVWASVRFIRFER